MKFCISLPSDWEEGGGFFPTHPLHACVWLFLPYFLGESNKYVGHHKWTSAAYLPILFLQLSFDLYPKTKLLTISFINDSYGILVGR